MKKETVYVSVEEAQKKLEYYCAYQDRCLAEVNEKLREFRLIPEAANQVVMYLYQNKYINEERFARSFVRGKHHYKKWGKIKIKKALQQKDIPEKLITMAMEEIDQTAYESLFFDAAKAYHQLQKPQHWMLQKKQFIQHFTQKGYEFALILNAWDDLHIL